DNARQERLTLSTPQPTPQPPLLTHCPRPEKYFSRCHWTIWDQGTFLRSFRRQIASSESTAPAPTPTPSPLQRHYRPAPLASNYQSHSYKSHSFFPAFGFPSTLTLFNLFNSFNHSSAPHVLRAF